MLYGPLVKWHNYLMRRHRPTKVCVCMYLPIIIISIGSITVILTVCNMIGKQWQKIAYQVLFLISVGPEGSLQKLFEVFVLCVHGFFFVSSFQHQIVNSPFIQNHQGKFVAFRAAVGCRMTWKIRLIPCEYMMLISANWQYQQKHKIYYKYIDTYPVMHPGHFGDQNTSLGTQNLAPEKNLLSFFFHLYLNRKYV